MLTTSEGEFDTKNVTRNIVFKGKIYFYLYILSEPNFPSTHSLMSRPLIIHTMGVLLFSLGLGLYHVKLAPSDANLPVTLQRMQFPVRLDDHKQIPGPNI